MMKALFAFIVVLALMATAAQAGRINVIISVGDRSCPSPFYAPPYGGGYNPIMPPYGGGQGYGLPMPYGPGPMPYGNPSYGSGYQYGNSGYGGYGLQIQQLQQQQQQLQALQEYYRNLQQAQESLRRYQNGGYW